MSIADLPTLLAYYTIFTTVAAICIVVLTLIILRRDKHFALALSFCEVAIYVAVSTFGQSPLSKAALAVGGIRAELDLAPNAEPPYYEAALVILFAGILSVIMMALRTWDKQIPKNPGA